jgi:uncharacterized protein YhaN
VKINNLHIASFGKLADVTMTFEPGMNLILEDNEFGKSTILSFIRAMFYGFPQRSATRSKDHDRKKFAPWKGGSFGGSIEFSHEGKTYLLEKTFAPKRADDKVILTLLPSGKKTDLAQSEVGEYLFAITEAEFVNTVFIGQLASNILDTQKETDVISARLANLAGTGSEIFSREEIKARLVNASSKLAAQRGTGGLIPKLEGEITELDAKEAEFNFSFEQAEQMREEVDLKQDLLRLISAELDEAAQALSNRKTAGEELSSAIQRQEILLEKAVQKERLEMEQSQEKAKYERDLLEHRRRREEIYRQLTEECAQTEKEISRLDLEDRNNREQATSLINALDMQLKKQDILCRENKALYENKVQETANLEEEILVVSAELKNLIQTREEIRKGRTTVFGYRMKTRRYEILFLAAFAVSMIFYGFLRDPIQLSGGIFLILAVLLRITNMSQLRFAEKKLTEKSIAHEAKLKIYENAAAAQYDRQTEFIECEKKQTEIFAQRTRIEENAQRDQQFCGQLTAQARDRLAAVKNREAQFADVSDADPDTVIDPVTPDYPCEVPPSTEEIISIQALSEQIKAGQTQLEGIRGEISNLLRQEETLKSKVMIESVEIARKETVLDGLLSKVSDLSWIEEQRALLTERLAEAKAYHHALLTAQGVLDEAFTEMENFFAPQVNEKAGEYLKKLTGGVYSTLHVDRSFGIDVAAEGSYSFHRADFFSGGTVDQIYFALRLAITDLIFTSDDKMPLLLDDSFVQYDDKRAKAGLALLHELASQRQIVLFTCHSRMREINASIGEN